MSVLPPVESECSVPPAPSASAALGAAPSLWVRQGGGRGGRGGLATSVALPCSVLLTFPRLQGLVAELQRIPFPCPRWVWRGIFSAWGRNSSVGWGQHLGAPGHAEIPVAKGEIEQGGRTQVPSMARAGGLLHPCSRQHRGSFALPWGIAASAHGEAGMKSSPG